MLDFSPMLNCEYFLSRFNKDRYPQAFSEYMTECAPLFEALKNGESPENLAGSLLDDIGARLDAIGLRRKRQNKETSFRTVIALYLSPAALEDGSQPCAEFADTLRKQWRRKFHSAYELGRYSELMDGFKRTMLLGFRLR